MKQSINNQRGFILPLVLVVMAVLIGGSTCLLTQGVGELKANVLNREYELCILTGKNAMAVVQSELENNIHYSGTNGMVFDENGGFYRINITETAENLKFVDIKIRYGDTNKNFSGEIEITPKDEDANTGIISKFKWKMVGGE